MKINTTLVSIALLTPAVTAYALAKGAGITESLISRIKSGERKIENLTYGTIIKIQKWIDEGHLEASGVDVVLINYLEKDIKDGKLGETVFAEMRKDESGKSYIYDYHTDKEYVEMNIFPKPILEIKKTKDLWEELTGLPYDRLL